jgi:hypothetical protein
MHIFSTLLGAALLGGALVWPSSCKPRLTSNPASSAKDSPVQGSCDLNGIFSKINELNAYEGRLILGQHLKYAIETSGPCTLPKIECQDQCATANAGISSPFFFPTGYEKCLDGCLTEFSSCEQANRDAVTQGRKEGRKDSLKEDEVLSARSALLLRRETLLREIHSCSTSADKARDFGQQSHSILSKEDEWALQKKIWNNLLDADYAVFATYRFPRGTELDIPARRGFMTRAEWQGQYQADSYLMRVGLKIMDAGFDARDAASRDVSAILSIGTASSTKAEGSHAELAASSQHVVNIVSSCANVTDTCTAISCLGHRTQEVMSVRDNLDHLEMPEFTRDGRKFALCRHYAPTFAAACNQWAKAHGVSDKMSCSTEGKFSLFHAYPIISVTDGGKSYQYIYDLLNDPMTPDLVPINDPATESVRVPCPSVN